MKIKRVILSGILVWSLVFSAFTLSSFVQILEDQALQNNLVLAISLIPFGSLGAFIYYQNGDKTNGLVVGSILFITAMILDAIVTVPLIIIPEGGSYLAFFTDPILWMIAIEYVMIIFLYWRIKVKPAIVFNH